MSESIEDSELLYRRIPASTGWYCPDTGEIKPEAFAPHKTNDVTGLSFSRAKFRSPAEAARGQPGKSYYVAVIEARTLRANGIAVVQVPPEDPSHAELPDLNAGNRKTDLALERQREMVRLCLRVEGPFLSSAEGTSGSFPGKSISQAAKLRKYFASRCVKYTHGSYHSLRRIIVRPTTSTIAHALFRPR